MSISTAEQAATETALSVSNAIQEARENIRRDRAAQMARDLTRDELFPDHNRAGYGVAVEYEQMGNQPVSDDLAARASGFGYEFEHLGLTIGTVIHDIDLSTLVASAAAGDDVAAQVRTVRDTLLERKVIFFRDQHLEEDEQVAFGRLFGDLDAFPFGPTGGNPYILEIGHGRSSPGRENVWHTDVTWMERPSLGSVAQCIEVPPAGGDTLFADSYAAYHGLPFAIQDRLQTLAGYSDYRVFLQSGASALPDDLIADIKSQVPFGVSHPLLRTHPETGKTALYIHGEFLRRDSLYDSVSGDELGAEASMKLVRTLLAQHARPEYQCRFVWEQGSMAFWDNRAVQHYAASDYYPHRRVLRRVTVSGDVPFYDPTRGVSAPE